MFIIIIKPMKQVPPAVPPPQTITLQVPTQSQMLAPQPPIMMMPAPPMPQLRPQPLMSTINI